MNKIFSALGVIVFICSGCIPNERVFVLGDYNRNVEVITIVKESRILKRTVKRKPKRLNENEFYFDGGDWTEMKRAIATSF